MSKQYTQRQYLQALQWFYLQQNTVISKQQPEDTNNIIDINNNDLVDTDGNKVLATEVS